MENEKTDFETPIILSTSWGETENTVDPKVMKRYQRFLQKMCLIGETLVHILVWALAFAVVGLMFSKNLENIIFSDGSEFTCVLDGNTERIVNVNNQ